MVAEITCIYAKYGKCKKEDCKYHHPHDICCDKTCEVHFCMKKHPRHCRYFWGFNACRNKDSCKFQHNKPSDNTHVEETKALDQKYSELLSQLNHYKSLCDIHDNAIVTLKQQLEEQAQEIHHLRSCVFPEESSQYESDFNQSELDNVTVHHDDHKNESAQMIIGDCTEAHKDINDMDQEMDDEDQSRTDRAVSDNMNTSKLLLKHKLQTNILNIENLEGEIIKIKDFVAREKMVAKGMNETRQKLKILNNEIKAKFGKTSSEKKIIKEIESLTEKVLKIKNNFKKSVGSELEKCAEICREEIVNLEKKVLLTK